MKKHLWAFVLILCIPTFFLMLRPGIFSTQDFHYFRLVEFDRCVRDLQIPCRWSSYAGLGFGEPLFNFYGQLAYVPSELVHLLGFSFIDSLKFGFIFSLVVAAFLMYLLARKLWKNNMAALVSSMFYTYAPYRAVDIWVRGALPESMSFVVFPLILLVFENYLDTKDNKYLLLFSLSLALLIGMHNLSLLMFMPILFSWVIYRLFTQKKLKFVFPVGLSVVFAILLSAYYILPVVFESNLVNLESTIRGYFDYRGHFAGINQLLFSRFWGYGGSVFGPEDGVSLSIGQLQWIVSIVSLALLVAKKKIKNYAFVLVFMLLGISMLFLTHNKSTPIWEAFFAMAYIQFPWRFLGVAIFCFSLVSGGIVLISKKYSYLITALLVGGVILFNSSFFRPDIWYQLGDSELTKGDRWIEQTRASIGDYWPKSAGPIPQNFSPEKTIDYELIEKRSNKIVYKILSDKRSIVFPINEFPGWRGEVADSTAIFTFHNTLPRSVGNWLTLVSIAALIFLLSRYTKHAKN